LNETVEHVKTNLMPDFDFDAFNHDTPYEGEGGESGYHHDAQAPVNEMPEPTEENHTSPASTYDHNADNGSTEEVDKW
jgi:hypothetical protein